MRAVEYEYSVQGSASCCRRACFFTASVRKSACRDVGRSQWWQAVEIVPECADTVSRLPPPFLASVSPGPGREVRNGIGWTSLEKTAGQGTAVGPQTGKRCWSLLSRLWRAVAPLMKPRCAEGDVPTAANLNLHRKRKSHAATMSLCVGIIGKQSSLFQ